MNLFEVVAFLEAIHTSAGINHFLPAGEERMAFRANFNANVFFGGTGMDHIAASAGDRGVHILRMDSLLHDLISFTLMNGMMDFAIIDKISRCPKAPRLNGFHRFKHVTRKIF